MNQFIVEGILSHCIVILVFFVGVSLTRSVPFLRKTHIPEPVTGGLIAAIVVYLIFVLFGTEITFELETRDVLLVYFFTCIYQAAVLSAGFGGFALGATPPPSRT